MGTREAHQWQIPSGVSVTKRRVLMGAVAAVAIVGAYLAGRFTAPTKVTTTATEHIAAQTTTVDKASFTRDTDKESTTRRRIVRTKVTSPDGTIRQRETISALRESATTARTAIDAQTDTASTVKADRTVTRVEERGPSFRVGLALSIPPLDLRADALKVGVLIEPFHLGPFSLGALVQSRPADLLKSLEVGGVLTVGF